MSYRTAPPRVNFNQSANPNSVRLATANIRLRLSGTTIAEKPPNQTRAQPATDQSYRPNRLKLKALFVAKRHIFTALRVARLSVALIDPRHCRISSGQPPTRRCDCAPTGSRAVKVAHGIAAVCWQCRNDNNFRNDRTRLCARPLRPRRLSFRPCLHCTNR